MSHQPMTNQAYGGWQGLYGSMGKIIVHLYKSLSPPICLCFQSHHHALVIGWWDVQALIIY